MLDSQTFRETMTFKAKPKKLESAALWEYALRVLDRRAHSSSELKKKLSLRAASTEALHDCMTKLAEYGLLDDKRFAETYAAARLEAQGFGAGRVLRDLRARNIPQGLAENTVRQVYADTQETELIARYLERKFRGKNLSQYLSEDKHLASAYRRLRTAGFGSAAAIRVLKQFAAKASDLEGMDENETARSEDPLT